MTDPVRKSIVSGLLRQQRIAERNVLTTERTVITYGLNIALPGQALFAPENLAHDKGLRRAYVEYSGGRARLVGSFGDPKWRNHPTDISGQYKRNVAAERLFAQPSTRRDIGDPLFGRVYGDALLFTNARTYWWINPNLIYDEESLHEAADLISTKYIIAEPRKDEQGILLIEPPIEEDLVALALMLC